MGQFYTNYTLRGVDQAAAAEALKGKKTFVSPMHNGCIVVSEEDSDTQDQEVIAKLAVHLSSSLHCAVLALLIHDDDILWYQLYENGALRDQYDSTPGYFDFSGNSSDLPPAGGDALKLCSAFGSGDPSAIEGILREPFGGKYVFAGDRHADLIQQLNLPKFAVGFSYRGTAEGFLPAGLKGEGIVSTS
jgi:hypothetical protein